MLHHITSYYITLDHITSYYIILHHVTSYYIIVHHITSYYIILHHITWYYIMRLKTWGLLTFQIGCHIIIPCLRLRCSTMMFTPTRPNWGYTQIQPVQLPWPSKSIYINTSKNCCRPTQDGNLPTKKHLQEFSMKLNSTFFIVLLCSCLKPCKPSSLGELGRRALSGATAAASVVTWIKIHANTKEWLIKLEVINMIEY